MKYLVVVVMLSMFTPPPAPPRIQGGEQINTPYFEMWVECIERGPYAGRADAQVGYRFDGAFAIMAEDSRYYGDIGTDNIQLAPFAIEPGEHPDFMRFNVGAFKVVVWKVVFMDRLHVLTVWDDPVIDDCAWQTDVEPMPTPTREAIQG